MADPMRPPARIQQSELMKAARHLERLKLRRRAMLKKLDALNDQIRQATHALRDLAADAVKAPLDGTEPDHQD